MRPETWNRKLSVLSARHKDGKVIWFARTGFTDPDYRHLDPKFHKFKDRRAPDLADIIEGDRWSREWVAECGYSRIFSEGLLEDYPKIRAAQAPKVDERCRKCNR